MRRRSFIQMFGALAALALPFKVGASGHVCTHTPRCQLLGVEHEPWHSPKARPYYRCNPGFTAQFAAAAPPADGPAFPSYTDVHGWPDWDALYAKYGIDVSENADLYRAHQKI